MDKYYLTSRGSFEQFLVSRLTESTIYAPFRRLNVLDYERVNEENVKNIALHEPLPATPLKTFFLPIRKNVTLDVNGSLPAIILGVPACDLAALDLLDAVYLDPAFPDDLYRKQREQTILIGTDCHSHLKHCHCTIYNINPFPERNCDLVLSGYQSDVFIRILSDKGQKLLNDMRSRIPVQEATAGDLETVKLKRMAVRDDITRQNQGLPDLKHTSTLLKQSEYWLWKKYASTCVGCGACAAICPTCTCFLLLDRPEFEKVRQLDTCQYPDFQRVAAGEDPLAPLTVRFRNRYLCKYVWRPERYKVSACTGCGRCIDACPGNISKNELLTELNTGEVKISQHA